MLLHVVVELQFLDLVHVLIGNSYGHFTQIPNV